MRIDPDRIAEAQLISLEEVAFRLGIEGLNRSGAERVGPCPVCGGHDRFGLNLTKGLWLCRKCPGKNSGDAIELVRHVQACSFGEAVDFLIGRADLTLSPEEKEKRRLKCQADKKKREQTAERMRRRAISHARAIWGAAWPHPSRGGEASIAPVEAYLAGRGIAFEDWPPALRYLPDHPATKTIAGKSVELHRGPCMVAAIQDADSQITAVHQTWIDADHPGSKAAFTYPDGKPAPAKMVRGSKKGGAIRLTPGPGNGLMIMGEGIETTASIFAAGYGGGAAFWAGVDLGNMGGKQIALDGQKNTGLPDLTDRKAFVPPEGITRLVFLQDGDSAHAPTLASLEAGIRRAMTLRKGLRGLIVPAAPGMDFNDMLQKKAVK